MAAEDSSRDRHVFLADVTRAITCLLQDREVRRRAELGIERPGLGPVQMPPFVAAREQTGAADPAGRRRDKGVLKTHALGRQTIDVGRLDNRVAGAAECVVALIVGEEQQNVGPAELSSSPLTTAGFTSLLSRPVARSRFGSPRLLLGRPSPRLQRPAFRSVTGYQSSSRPRVP